MRNQIKAATIALAFGLLALASYQVISNAINYGSNL